MFKALLTYTAEERRATLMGINLFFSALLGANLGSINDIPLDDYFHTMILVVGAVTGILTIAVARRRTTMISMSLAFIFLIVAMLLLPGVADTAGGDSFKRLALTLGAWLVMLVLVRLTPAAEEDDHDSNGGDLDDEDAFEVPVPRRRRSR